MARKAGGDGRQTDFFGAPPAPPPPHKPAARPKPPPEPPAPPPAVAVVPAPPERDDGFEAEFARLSQAEIRQMVATLPDAALAQLTLATIRQLKRRLEREFRRNGGKPGNTVLDRAAQQLVAELGGQNDDYDS